MKQLKKGLMWGSALALLLLPITTVFSQSEGEVSFDNLINQAVEVENALITVGTIKDGESSYRVYSADESVDSGQVFEYEIGSITKTFTGILIAKAVDEGLVDLDSEMSEYLSLTSDLEFPTVRQLLTHTSGYPTLIENQYISRNILADANPYIGVTAEMMLEEASENVPDMSEAHEFQYSNFNAGLLGLILESIYGESYSNLLTVFITEDLGLESTHFFDTETELGNNWVWTSEDAYAPAGSIISTIEDMLLYTQMQFESEISVPPMSQWIDQSHQSLATIDATTNEMELYGLRQDEMGYQWMLNTQDNIVWHDGATGGYTAFLGFNKEEQTSVVVLSNVAIHEGITSAMIGGVLLEELLEE